LVTLVTPVGWQIAFSGVVACDSAYLGLDKFELTTIVQVLAIVVKVVDEADCPAKEIHYFLGYIWCLVVITKNFHDLLAKEQLNIWDRILVSEDCADYCRRFSLFVEFENSCYDFLFVLLRPFRNLADIRTAGTRFALAATVHSSHVNASSGPPTYCPLITTPP